MPTRRRRRRRRRRRGLQASGVVPAANKERAGGARRPLRGRCENVVIRGSPAGRVQEIWREKRRKINSFTNRGAGTAFSTIGSIYIHPSATFSRSLPGGRQLLGAPCLSARPGDRAGAPPVWPRPSRPRSPPPLPKGRPRPRPRRCCPHAGYGSWRGYPSPHRLSLPRPTSQRAAADEMRPGAGEAMALTVPLLLLKGGVAPFASTATAASTSCTSGTPTRCGR